MSARELNLNAYRSELTVRAGDLKKTLSEPADTGDRKRFLRLLRQIEYALCRLERRRHGECVKCQGSVEQPILDMAPWAIFCNNCQRVVDLLQAEAESRRNVLTPAA